MLDASWLRRFARDLVGDAARGDDLAQAAWLELASAKRGDVRKPRAFVRGVVRKLWSQLRRSEVRRGDRERAAARDEVLPSSDELVARLELQRIVAAIVAGLAEPQRTTILLRYVEDLSSAEIARRLAVPAGTVRARLKRGLDEVRAELDRRFRGRRSDWLEALAPWLPRGKTAVFVGALAMKKLMWAAAVVVLALAAWWGVDSVRSRMTIGDPDVARAGEPQLPAPPISVASSGERVAQSDSLVAPIADSVAPIAEHTIFARALDHDRKPIAGATMRLVDDDAIATGAADGELKLVLPDARLAALRARDRYKRLFADLCAPSFEGVEVSFDFDSEPTIYLGDSILEPGGSIAGRVVDETGRGVRGALVVADRATGDDHSVEEDGSESSKLDGPWARDPFVSPHSRHWIGQSLSNERGEFELDGLGVGFWIVWVHTTDVTWTHSTSVAVRAGQVVRDLDIQLAPETPASVIRGRLVDPKKHPMPFTVIRTERESGRENVWYSAHREVVTDADGRFTIIATDATPRWILAQPPVADWEWILDRNVAVGTSDLELAFNIRETCDVAVADANGTPIRDARLIAHGSNPFLTLHRGGSPLESRTGSDGHARFPLPDVACSIGVDCDGYRTASFGPFDPERLRSGASFLLESAPRRAAIRGVVTCDGKPLMGATVRLFARRDDSPAWSSNGNYHFRGSRFVDFARETQARQLTDDAGRFTVALPQFDDSKNTWYLAAWTNELASRVLGPLSFDANHGVDGLALDLTSGGAVEGRVTAQTHGEIAGHGVAATNEWGEVREVVVGHDGAFRIEHLRAGRWQLRATEPANRRSEYSYTLAPDEPTSTIAINESGTVHCDVVIADEVPIVLEGDVRLSGCELAGWYVNVQPYDRGSSLDPDGRFRIELPHEGKCQLLIGCEGGSPQRPTVFDEIVVARGTNRWSIDLALTRLRGSTRKKSDVPRTRDLYFVNWLGNQRVSQVSLWQEGGEFEALVPTARGELRGGEVFVGDRLIEPRPALIGELAPPFDPNVVVELE